MPKARLPKARDDWRPASMLSFLVHLAIIALLIVPLTVQNEIVEREQGAGGPGPAGGGGGGRRGTGALQQELLRFVRVQPAPPPSPVPQIEPEIKPPPVVPPPEPPKPAVVEEAPKVVEANLPVGVGGGTGSDTTGGSGSGTGGGVGTGIGTGRGSAIGPGTGGGSQANYPPSLIDLFIPPTPVPRSVSGARVVAEFDVDEKGKVLSVTFTQTRDRGYNRKLSELFKEFKFRPGSTPDGRAIRMKAQVAFDL